MCGQLYTLFYLLNKRLGEPQNRSGHFGKEQIMTVTGIELQPVCNNSAITTAGA
jgi:hypothetical protein